jgi:hypothetical protein
METQKHTPGDWHRNIKPASKYPTIFAGRNKHVCVLCTDGLTKAEIEGNADLIKEAPAMLSVLCELVNDFEGCPENIDFQLWLKIEAAIARATGQKP